MVHINATGHILGQCRYAPRDGGRIVTMNTSAWACANEVRSTVNATQPGFNVTARAWTTSNYFTVAQQQIARNQWEPRTATARNQVNVSSGWVNNFLGDARPRGSWW